MERLGTKLGGRSAATPAVYISRLYSTEQYCTVQAGCLYISAARKSLTVACVCYHRAQATWTLFLSQVTQGTTSHPLTNSLKAMCLAISSDARVSIKRHFFCSFIDVPTLNLFVIIHLGYKISRLQNKSYFFYGHSVGNMRRNKINIYARPGQIIHQLRRGSDMYGSTKLILRENNDKRKKWGFQGFKVTHWPIHVFKEAAWQLKNYFYSLKQNILWMMMINWIEWHYFHEVPQMVFITNYITMLQSMKI